MLNYRVDAALLRARVPTGTELDDFAGQIYLSGVGFLFARTRVLGIPVPFHRHFAEVNLRFYVRRQGPEGWRRGVVFVKELVPRVAVAAMARLLYNENYAALPMRSRLAMDTRAGGTLEYGWRHRGRWCALRAGARGPASPLEPGSEAEFITEHHWGYARQRDGGTIEYRVEHPRWRVWTAAEGSLDCDVASLYGPEFHEPLSGAPASTLIA